MGNWCPKPVNSLSSTSKFSLIPVPSNPKTKKKAIKTNEQPTTAAEGRSPEPVLTRGQIVTPNLKIYTFAELRSATKNFRPATILGEGGFGQVFKGWVDGVTYAPSKAGVGIPVAVKKSDSDSFQGLKEWQAEVKFLGKFSHPNLVKLLGYCWENNEFLLVYEYMQKGSLENHLFKTSNDFNEGLLSLTEGLRRLPPRPSYLSPSISLCTRFISRSQSLKNRNTVL